MLVREADRRLSLTAGVAALVKDTRQSGKVVHEVQTMIRQRVYGMCSGNEDLNDFDQLRNDPLWQTACDVDRPFGGKSTLCRFENKADRQLAIDRKSTRLNSSHVKISYAVFCLNKTHHKLT